MKKIIIIILLLCLASAGIFLLINSSDTKITVMLDNILYVEATDIELSTPYYTTSEVALSQVPDSNIESNFVPSNTPFVKYENDLIFVFEDGSIGFFELADSSQIPTSVDTVSQSEQSEDGSETPSALVPMVFFENNIYRTKEDFPAQDLNYLINTIDSNLIPDSNYESNHFSTSTPYIKYNDQLIFIENDSLTILKALR